VLIWCLEYIRYVFGRGFMEGGVVRGDFGKWCLVSPIGKYSQGLSGGCTDNVWIES